MKRYIFLYFIILIWNISLFSQNKEGNVGKQIEDVRSFHYNFELAQDYKQSQEYDNAIKHYEISRLDDSELGWYSEYMIGKCYAGKTDWVNALDYYHAAFERRKTRSEPLFDIAHYYVSLGHHQKAYSYLQTGDKIPYPHDDKLFIDSMIYKYKFKELLGIASYYVNGHKALGLKNIDQIAFDATLPADIKNVNLFNSLHYIENIPNAHFIHIDPLPPVLNDWSIDRYKPCNPSIIKTKDGYLVNCRTVNYVQWCPGHLFVDGSGKGKTKNMLIQYDKEFNTVSQTCVKEQPSLAQYDNGPSGLEDLRIFHLDNEVYFSASTCQFSNDGKARICVGKFEADLEDCSVTVKKATVLHGPDPIRTEKNWLPFVVNGEFFTIYSYSPYIVYRPCLDTGICREVINKSIGLDFSKLCGSAHPIPFDDGYLLMVHEGIWNVRRFYLHRFLYLDKDLEIKKYSAPFSFRHKGIEMCCGMVTDHAEKNLVMAIALEDREAYLCSVDLQTIRSMLQDLTELKI